jgi:2-(1,2-epoxy-1,2-dihydrophenyl)acetyl-CoA isomerase
MIRYETADRVATITIDRPEVKNALGPDEWHAIRAHALAAGADPSVRVVVVRGAGGVFSAGGDLKSMPERLALDKHVRRAQLLADAQVIVTLRELPKPVVAVIEGAAVGAGLSLALACDVRLVAAEARLGAVFHKIGLTADFGLSWLLPRVVGPTRAMDLLMSAALVDGARAVELGLCTRAWPAAQLATEAEAYVRRIADGPPLAIARTKAALHASEERTLAQMLAFEAEAQAFCSKTEDVREGIAAFFAKRAPKFEGC